MNFETTIDQRISVLKKLEAANKKELQEKIDLVWDQIEMNTHMAFGSILSMSNICHKHFNFLKNNDKNYKQLLKFYPINDLQINNKNSSKVLEFVKTQDQRRNISINSYFPEFNSLYQ